MREKPLAVLLSKINRLLRVKAASKKLTRGSSSSCSSARCVLRLASSMERTTVISEWAMPEQEAGSTIPNTKIDSSNAAAAASSLTDDEKAMELSSRNLTESRSSKLSRELRSFSDPARDLRIYAVTWNMNSQMPLDDFGKLVDQSPGFYDVYVVGLQEAPRYSLRRRLLHFLGKQYSSVAKTVMGSLHLYIFARTTLLPHISDRGVDKVKFKGFGGVIGRQKGAVAAFFHIGTSSFLFIASHFAAHENNLRKRNFQYMRTRQKIFSRTASCFMNTISLSNNNNNNASNVNKRSSDLDNKNDFTVGGGDLVDESDVVIWLGDLNYRIEGSRKLVKSYLKYDLGKLLWKRDQLFNEVDKGQVFSGFVEGPLAFKPTYKYDIGTDNYDTNKERVPSWTDRVLIKVKEDSSLNVEVVDYDSIDSLRVSDHRPVRALLHFTNTKH